MCDDVSVRIMQGSVVFALPAFGVKQMKDSYNFLYEGGQDEIVEKKSRFIGITYPIDSEEEAVMYIEECKKKYWDARHRCFAYVLGENMELQRFSDDGEPQGTAGKPILETLLGSQVHNCLVIVVRYFGGTLLGTGGLVRAYSQAAKAGLEAGVVLEKIRGVLLNVTTDYNSIGKIQYLLGNRSIDIWKSEYGENVALQVLVPADLVDKIMEEITEVTSAKAIMKKEKNIFFAKSEKDVLIFDE